MLALLTTSYLELVFLFIKHQVKTSCFRNHCQKRNENELISTESKFQIFLVHVHQLI